MSIKLMSQVWEKELSPGQQRVLLVLCDHANDQGTNCYPSVEYIAWKIGITPRTVMRMIAELEDMGAIQVRREHRKRNLYRIRLHKLPSKPPFRKDEYDDEGWPDDDNLGSQNVTQDNLGSQNVTQDDENVTQGVTKCHPKVEKMSPQPLVNHQNNRQHETPDRVSNETQVGASAPTPPSDDDSLSGLEGFRSAVKERKSKKSPAPQPPTKDDRRVWGIVDTYFTARDIPGNMVSKRERNQVYNIFAGLHSSISWEDIEGCTKYLRTVSWQQEPGQPTADMVSRSVLDWIQKGRPQTSTQKGGGSSGFASGMRQFADYAKEQGQ